MVALFTAISQASAPVKASICAQDVLAFTEGACAGDYGSGAFSDLHDSTFHIPTLFRFSRHFLMQTDSL